MKGNYGESKVENETLLSQKDFVQPILETVREPVLVLDKMLKVVLANKQFYHLFGQSEEETEGRNLLLTANQKWATPEVENLLQYILPEEKKVQDYKFNLRSSDAAMREFEVNVGSLQDEDGEELFLLSFRPIFQKEENGKSQLKSLKDILAKTPAMICTLRGPEHTFELGNEKYFDLVGNRDILGKTVREALPEVENQGFIDILDQVYKTGQPFIGNEIPIKLNTCQGKLKNSFLDFVYQPTRDASGNVEGIFVHAIDVTEKVISRKKIEESEHELRTLVETVPAIIWITDKEGRSSYFNENWFIYTGQTKEESGGYGWLNSVHPEDRELAEKSFREAVKTRGEFYATYRLYIQKGGYRWVIDTGSPKFNSEGEYEGMIGTVVDVHEEKIKEQLVREKDHRTRTIVEEATVATAVYSGPEMIIELANEAMIEVWGKDRSVIGKSLREALPELDGQPFHQILDEVYSTGKTYWGKEERADLEIKGEIKTGYFNFTYKPLRNEQGEIYGILNMAMDVSEMVESKFLIKESESHFRQMANLMPGKVSTTDEEGNAVYFNQNWLEFTGIDSEKLSQDGWMQFIHPDEKIAFEKEWRESLKSGNDFEMEVRLRDKNHKYKWHLSRAEAVKNERGRIKMWISTNTEIQKLKEEEKRKEDFLKMVSHELKTPVTSIKGYVQLLLNLLQKQKQQNSGFPIIPSLERIDHQINRLTRLLSEMLDLSRLEENKLELQKVCFNLNDLVEETVQDINYTNTQHQINVQHELVCDIVGDRDRIGQVLVNFITNSIKYSPESQNIEVKITKSDKDTVGVSVKDYGIGIERGSLQKIFKRFYRIGGKSEETYSGFGIGLYLANEIIQRHRGSINVESKVGEGSIFSFYLDIASEN